MFVCLFAHMCVRVCVCIYIQYKENSQGSSDWSVPRDKDFVHSLPVSMFTNPISGSPLRQTDRYQLLGDKSSCSENDLTCVCVRVLACVCVCVCVRVC